MSATVTAAQNAANLRTVVKAVSAEMGVDPANLPDYQTRAAYNKAVAARVLQYPQSFTDSTLETARIVSERDYATLDDTSFAWGDFASAMADEARITLPAIGNKLLIGVVVVAAVYFGIRAWRSAPAPGA